MNDDAEPEDVRAAVGLNAVQLLRRHVLHRPEDRARHVTDVAAGSAAWDSRDRSRAASDPLAVNITFAGFRSRWMTPCRWALSSASPMAIATPSASWSGSGPRASRSVSVSPSRYSMTRYAMLEPSGIAPTRRRATRRCADASAMRRSSLHDRIAASQSRRWPTRAAGL